MSYYGDSSLADVIVGKTITGIWWSEETLTFETNEGLVTYWVDGDCCSHSYFFDFYGVEHLLSNGPVTAFEHHDLTEGDPGFKVEASKYADDLTQVYGYRFTTEHPKFGQVTSVLSFRNESNGYYGGSMELASEGSIKPDQVALTSDKVG